ncbi:phosphatidylglycerophosphate phosphatase 1, chloroplastic/mitochondrial-like [Curcuma longa]|uniref:phosphatidylglycerophosphate phosphatase 1, chloroplastic/mitochondrial-like n=1 Tax=Curcuma longa TaxID=136217 RepID=UPI003D9F75D9
MIRTKPSPSGHRSLLPPSLLPSLRLCRLSFPGSVVFFSNSSGLKQCDPDGAEAKVLEEVAAGIHAMKARQVLYVHRGFSLIDAAQFVLELVCELGRCNLLRRSVRLCLFQFQFILVILEVMKPSETVEVIESGRLSFTDVVYGNRHGFLTILTEPLNLSGEPFIVDQVFLLKVLLRLILGLREKLMDRFFY